MHKRIIKYFFICILVFVCANTKAQLAAVDSLHKKLNSNIHDTLKVSALLHLSHAYFGVQVDSVRKYAQLSLDLSKKINYRYGTLKALDFLAQYFWSTGNFENALQNLKDKLVVLEKYNNKNEMALTLGNIGLIYNNQSEFEKALEYYFKALKIEESINNTAGIARNLGNIGNVYLLKHEEDKALANFNKAYALAKTTNDLQLQVTNLNNIGALHYERYEFQKSLDCYTRSLALLENTGEKAVAGTTYMNIGNIYLYMGDSLKKANDRTQSNQYYSKALQYFNQALKLAKESGDINVLANSLGYLGDLYMSLNLYPKAEGNLKQSLAYAEQTGDLSLIKLQHETLSKFYNEIKKYDLSLLHYKAFIAARDSIFNEENTKNAVRLEMNFEFEKKAAATKLEQEKKEAIAATERKRQSILIWAVSGILLLVFGFAIFVYRSFLQKQKANKEIVQQKAVIEEKQKEILDSIHYAKRIQQALLPSEKYIKRSIDKLSKKV